MIRRFLIAANLQASRTSLCSPLHLSYQEHKATELKSETGCQPVYSSARKASAESHLRRHHHGSQLKHDSTAQNLPGILFTS